MRNGLRAAQVGLLLFAGLRAVIAQAVMPEIPPPPEFALYDGVHSLPSETKRALESLLVEHDRLTGEQIVFALVRLPKETDLQDYTHRLFVQWEIGQNGKGAGLLVVADETHQRGAFEVGFGLSPVLTNTKMQVLVSDKTERWLGRKQPARALIETAVDLMRSLGSPLIATGELDAIMQSLPAYADKNGAEVPPPVWIWIPIFILGVGIAWFTLHMITDADAHYIATGWSRAKPAELWFKIHLRKSKSQPPATGGTHGHW